MFTIIRKYFSPFVRHYEELNLLQIFKPLYAVLSTLGLFPNSIEFPSGNRNLKVIVKSSLVNPACTIIITIAISVGVGLHILEISIANAENSLTEDEITEVNYIAVFVIGYAGILTAYICAFKYKNWYIKFLNEIAACWEELPNSTTDILLGQLRIQVNCVVLVSFSLIVIVNSSVTYSQTVPAAKMVLIAVTFVLPAVVQYALIAFYFVMVLMVVALLKKIEEHVQFILCDRRMKASSNCNVRVESETSLRQLRGVYARALALKRQINAAFQAPLLLILAQALHLLVTVTHMLYHILTFQTDYSYYDAFELSCWMTYQLIKLYVLGQSGALLNRQGKQIGRTLHSIPVSVTEDTTTHLQIQYFTSSMTFEDTEITLFGYFLVKESMVFKILASAATYVVILVQFDNST